MSTTPACPICKQPLPEPTAAPCWPFCSTRCRAIDLGQWLSGRYVIPGERNVDERDVRSSRNDEE